MIRMTGKFNKLFEKVKFPNEAITKQRFVMSVMAVNSLRYEGNMGENLVIYSLLNNYQKS